MIFSRYAPSCKNGESWVTPEKHEKDKARMLANQKERYRKNPEKALKPYRDWLEKNRDKARQCCKNWAAKNKEKRKKDLKDWADENRDHLRMKYRKNSRRLLDSIKERRKNDPVFALKGIIRSRIKAAFKNKSMSGRTKINEYIGCEWEQLKTHIESKFSGGISWDNQGKWHVDHIVPLFLAKTEEEVRILNHYTNLQPLWGRDNLEKSCTIPAVLPDGIDARVMEIWKKSQPKT